MILENLKNFEWLNEPENVIFANKEMKIVPNYKQIFGRVNIIIFIKIMAICFFYE